MLKFLFHIYGVEIFQVEFLKELRNSFAWSKEEILCTVENLRKIFVP